MGATDVQVARLFQRRIALDALFGGLIGFIRGALVLVADRRSGSRRWARSCSARRASRPAPGFCSSHCRRWASARDAGRAARPSFGVGADAVIRWLFRLLPSPCCYVLGYALFAMMLPRPADDAPDRRRSSSSPAAPAGSSAASTCSSAHRAQRMLVSGVDRTVRPMDLANQYPGSGAAVRLLHRSRAGVGRHPLQCRGSGALEYWGIDNTVKFPGGLNEKGRSVPQSQRKIFLLQRTQGKLGNKLSKTTGWDSS